MNTYQIFETVSNEYFVEAESYEEALKKIFHQGIEPESTEIIDYGLKDTCIDNVWQKERV